MRRECHGTGFHTHHSCNTSHYEAPVSWNRDSMHTIIISASVSIKFHFFCLQLQAFCYLLAPPLSPQKVVCCFCLAWISS